MRKIFLTFIVLTFAHIVFAQNKQTVVVRPETAREKEERKMNDVVETFQMLGEFGKLKKEAGAENLKRVKNSKYSLYVEERLETWKEKGAFEKTADWQKRLNDSTAIKKAEIYESALDEFVQVLEVLNNDNTSLNGFFYNSKGQYDADKEVLVVNTFWGNIPIPIPLDEAKSWHNIQNVDVLDAHFFIQNDQLALLSLSTSGYTWENPSQSAQIVRKKRFELAETKIQISIATVEGEDVEGAIDIAELDKPKAIVEDKEEIYYGVEIPPSFPGGEDEMMKYILDNLVYPALAAKNGIEGRVTIRFVVNKKGEITDVTVLRGLDPSCDEEVIRVVKSMPKWVPGKQNGVNVNVYYTLPIVYKLQR
jgi:TonB family protein